MGMLPKAGRVSKCTLSDNINCKMTLFCDTADEMDMNECLPPSMNFDDMPSKRVMLSAAYVLQLEAEHKLTRRAVDSVVSTTSHLLSSQIASVKQEMMSQLSESGCDYDLLCNISEDCFSGLETHNKRVKFYRDNFGLVEPQEMYLGKVLTKRLGKIVTVKKHGVIVPFKGSLKAFLSLPDVCGAVA